MTEQRHARDGAPRHRVLLIVGICVLVVALAVGIVVGVSALPTRHGHAAADKSGSHSPASRSSMSATKLSGPATADPASPTSPPMSPSATPKLGGLVVPPRDPQAATKIAVAKAYLDLISAWNDLMITRSIDFTPLSDSADGDLLTAIEDEIQTRFYAKDYRERGRSLISELKITSISADEQTATLTACDDQSQISTVDAKTGVVVYAAKPSRILDSVTMRVRDGRWKVTGLTHPGYC